MLALVFAVFMQTPAHADDPLFSTYAAPLSRSEYLVDEAYHLRYYEPSRPLALTSDSAGSWGIGFELDGVVVHDVGDYATRPVVRNSLASLARFDFEPFHGVFVDATLSVYSSRQSLLALTMTNRTERAKRLRVHAFAEAPDEGFAPVSRTSEGDALVFGHTEPRGAWSESPPDEYENVFRDALVLDEPADAYGGYPAGLDAAVFELERGLVSGDLTGRAGALLLTSTRTIEPGASVTVRVVRAVSPQSQGTEAMLRDARALMTMAPSELDELEREEAELFDNAPDLSLAPDHELIYRGALALARQSMLPPEGRTRYNYYVFSREPVWSWGHDGQVFHESLSMLAYVHLDAASAMDSQRVFMEAQEDDGYIPYRMGSYVVRTFPVDGRRTTSAPFFSWTNWEVYRVARDRAFLTEAYRSGAKFAEFWFTERDRDGDGLLEWGGHAVLESVRDSLVPIWDLLGENDPTAPSKIEALDLNAMMVQEMRSLSRMARALGEPDPWDERAHALSALINDTMWDETTGFYYNVDRETNAFTTPDGHDLRRMEIIGFLPLWAGVAPPERAERLVRTLTDPRKFWRRYGVPTLAADDPGYQPMITRCCQWNGAVWMEWDYLVFRGLLDYGYRDEAVELGHRMLDAAATQLRRNHRFWESYSPDEVQLASPMNYIWDSILARVLIDLDSAGDWNRGAVAVYDMASTTPDGKLRDLSGNGHHGRFEAATIVATPTGSGRLFRAVGDRIHVQEHDDFDLDGPLTIAAKLRIDQGGLHQHVFACDDKWALWVTPDDRLRLGDTHGGGWSTMPGSVEEGKWTSVVAVLRGTKGDALTPDTVSLYVDGELADASRHLRTDEAREIGRWNPGELFPADACYIGFESHQGMESHRTMPFVGAIDTLSLYERAWTEDEVHAFSETR